MGHVDHQISADAVGNLAEFLEINDARIGRAARDDQLRLVFLGQAFDLIEVDQAALAAHTVLNRVKPLAGNVRRRAVGQVTTSVQGHAHDGVSRFDQRQINGFVGLSTGMGLHVDIGTVEQFLGALNCQVFGDIHRLAAAVIAFAGIAFRILIGQHRADRFQNRFGDNVFRSDQFDLVLLTGEFFADRAHHIGIALR